MRATNIEWDTGMDLAAREGLPKEIQIPPGTDIDAISDYLSDKTGWCHLGFELKPDSHIKGAKIKMPFFPEDVSWRLYYLTSPADLADVCMVLYREANKHRIQKMQDALYPCWAVFSYDEDDWGRCEGALPSVQKEWETAIANAVQEADFGPIEPMPKKYY